MVTSDGKVYMATLKGKSEMDVKVLWDDPKQKVAGVVQDQDNNAVYGWGYAGKDGSSDRFYLKFDPKPAPVRYALTVSLWRNITDAYLESYECARAFRKNKNK
ncbi:unnamed protein product [Gemmata massiliana]|uniref:Uncharacterized protein n=2 Tax=Gemmata massiliana TaxID=1210884 RepID=A0A6P2CWX0_9BACT|nr:unnamed protein product [Gemmata massiliana]